MAIYRILFIDRRERITAIDDFDAASKTAAIDTCTERRGMHYAVELWAGEVLVARLGPPKAEAERVPVAALRN